MLVFISLTSGVRRVQQRTRFATSEFRDKVTGALEFRNKFAECPFICRDLLKSEDLVVCSETFIM